MLPANTDSMRTEAYRLYQAGDHAGAESLCRTLLQLTPNNASTLYLLGWIAHTAGRSEEALDLFSQAARLAPDNPAMVNALGEAFLTSGQYGEAMDCFLRARSLRPSYAQSHNNLGRLFQIQGDLPAAQTCFSEAIRLDPRYATAHNNLGAVLLALNQLSAAADCFRQAIALKPDYAEAHFNLGCYFQAEGDPVSAAARLQEAVRLRPNYARAYCHLGQALNSLRRDYDALACFETAARLQPDDAEFQLELGCILSVKLDYEGSLKAFNRAVSLQPTRAEPFARRAQIRQITCDWRTYDSDLDRLWSDAEQQLAAGEATSVRPFQAVTLPWSLPRLLAIARSHCDNERGIRRLQSHQLDRPLQSLGRLRVGYLSPYFCDNPIGHLLQGFFGRHDRSHFEVFAYSFGPPDHSVYRRRIIAGCEHFDEVPALSILDLAGRIAADGIHIAVDLTGHAGVNRLGALALRPAPIQVSFLGMLGTMGADFIDYLITDRIATPPEFAEFFTEKFVTMPHSYLIAEPEPRAPDSAVDRGQYGLPEKGFVYCSFNGNHKIEPRIFAAWMRILAQVPDSVLWLCCNPLSADNLRREAKTRGVAPERLVFAPFVPVPEHLLRHRAADLFLDTLVYNAAATGSLALQTGLPVLTCLGNTFASRVCGSLLHSVNMPELIAPNLEEYERLAIELAHRPESLLQLREKLALSLATAPLFDVPRFVRNLEHAYQTMWELYCQGNSPQPISVVELQ